MRQMLAIVAVAVVIGLPGTQGATAEGTKMARGTVRTTAPDALTVQVGGNEITFKVDSSTLVTARSGSTAMQQARADGKTGVPYTDIVKVGQRVEVSYLDAGMHAARIRVLPGAPGQSKAGAAPAVHAPKALNADGVVTAVSDTLLTISAGKSGELTYAVDRNTKISGRGLGTQARAMKSAGERMVFSEFVHKGDTVQIRYDEAGGTKRASAVRVTR